MGAYPSRLTGCRREYQRGGAAPRHPSTLAPAEAREISRAHLAGRSDRAATIYRMPLRSHYAHLFARAARLIPSFLGRIASRARLVRACLVRVSGARASLPNV